MTTSSKPNNSRVKHFLTYHKQEHCTNSITKLFINNKTGPWKNINTKLKTEIKAIKKACK